MDFHQGNPSFKHQFFKEFGQHVYHLNTNALVTWDFMYWFFIGRFPNKIELKIIKNIAPHSGVFIVGRDTMVEFDIWYERPIAGTILLFGLPWKEIWESNGFTLPTEPEGMGGGGQT